MVRQLRLLLTRPRATLLTRPPLRTISLVQTLQKPARPPRNGDMTFRPELVWGFSCQVIFGAFFRPDLAAPQPRSATEGLGSHPQPRAAHTSARAWRGWRAAGLPGSEHRGILGYGRPADGGGE